MGSIKKMVLILIVLFMSMTLNAEYLFLTDGSIIKGSVVSETSAYVEFRAKGDKVVRYPRARVIRVLYTELNMGRVFVQRRDGEVFRVYMVDEDRTTYTFRRDLYKPEEFKINRADVLFMAERNPTGLKGTPGTDRVELEWLPSFEEMRHYNLYYRKRSEDYGTPVRVRETRYILRGLESNTEYTAKVTGYAGDGDETTPSNEFIFFTHNLPPYPPSGIAPAITEERGVKLTWNRATDPDGEVVSYRIYSDIDSELRLIAETDDTNYTIIKPFDYKRVFITAVDDSGYESAPGKARIVPLGISAGFTAGFIIPMSDFGERSDRGYGGSLTVTKHDIFRPGLEAALSAGLYYMPGIDNIDSDITKTGRAYFIPVSLSLGLRFNITEQLSSVPFIAGGAACLDLPYVKYDSEEDKYTDETLRDYGPTGGAGVLFEYSLSRLFYIGLRAETGFLVRSGIFNDTYTRFELGAGIRM